MIAASPPSTISAMISQVVAGTSPCVAPSIAWKRLNLATKPDSGGMPLITSAHAAKLSPRKVRVPGMPTPTGSSGLSSMAKASMVMARSAAPGGRMRSVSSISSMKAAIASVEPSR